MLIFSINITGESEVVMIVCVCHRVSEKEVNKAIKNGATSVSDVARACKAGTDCGACCCEIRDMLRAKESQPTSILRPSILAPAVAG